MPVTRHQQAAPNYRRSQAMFEHGRKQHEVIVRIGLEKMTRY